MGFNKKEEKTRNRRATFSPFPAWIWSFKVADSFVRLTTSFVSIYRRMFELNGRLRRAKTVFCLGCFFSLGAALSNLFGSQQVLRVQWRASMSSMWDTGSKHQSCQQNKQRKYKVPWLSTVIPPIDAAPLTRPRQTQARSDSREVFLYVSRNIIFSHTWYWDSLY